MSKTDFLLNSLERNVSNNYELSNFEIEQSYEVENFLKENYGMDRASARTKAQQIVADPIAYKQVQMQMTQNGGMGKMVQGTRNVSSAFFNIKIKRSGVPLIDKSLPVPLFGYNSLADLYIGILSSELPAGVTVYGVQMGGLFAATPPPVEGASNPANIEVSDRLLITFTDGAAFDNVEVTCNEVAYPYFVQSMGTDSFTLSKMRLNISDNTKTEQFNNKLTIKSKTMFGKDTADSITPTQFQDPKQFQDGIIDIDGNFNFDRNSVLIVPIIPVEDFTLTLSAMVETYYRQG